MPGAFDNVGLNKGLHIWRVENFQPVAVPKTDYGKFYNGDAYIVLSNRDERGSSTSDVHFWLGSSVTRDEAGAAAILTVQLDDVLHGIPIQHREVQDHESELFLSYFKHGIRYAEGGVKSGFNAVETNAAGEKRLFQVKGKKNIRVKQVDLSVNAMNKGDCFILDAGNHIYVFVGKTSKRLERVKAISAANQIRDQDHGGRSTISILDEFSSDAEQKEFFRVLGSGSTDEIADAEEDDAEFETREERQVTLFKVSDASGEMVVEEIAQRPLKQEMLDTNECFILDTGSSIIVWIGKGADTQERSQAMTRAQDFIISKNYPMQTKIQRIVENAETAQFKQYFTHWRDANLSALMKAVKHTDSEEDFDVNVLHTFRKSGGRAIGFMPDDGENEAEVWRVERFELIPIEPLTYGMFFGGDSYVIKYEYRNRWGGHGYIIYYWQGKHSSLDERASAAMHAVRLDNELSGGAIQVRAVQGHEPRHFLKIFKGRMIAFEGGKASGFKNIQDYDTYDVDGTRLFRIRGTSADDVRAVQMPERASSLASSDVFVLETKNNTFIWIGEGAIQIEREMASIVVGRLSHSDDVKLIYEGCEPEEFWEALGGKGDYDTELDPPGAPFLEPRLFHCHLWHGKLRVEEVPHFDQEDLNQDDVMILDGGDEIYVWVGKGASQEEREKSMFMAKEYIRTDPSYRSEETVPIIQLRQGEEPRSFKRFFPDWDDEMWKSIVSYEEFKREVLESNKA